MNYRTLRLLRAIFVLALGVGAAFLIDALPRPPYTFDLGWWVLLVMPK